jgi:hypothetical protein
MGLLDDLKNKDNFVHSSRGKCTFCTFLETIAAEESKLISERVADKNITSSSLSRVLRKNGYNLSEGVISRHRRGECLGSRG